MTEPMKTDNELIAEFMGGKRSQRGQDTVFYFTPDFKGSGFWHIDYIPFDRSWDWLMPVVKKIYLIRTVELEMSMGQLRINCLLYGGFFGSAFCIAEKTDIECWYMSVVEFIKWYNQQSL